MSSASFEAPPDTGGRGLLRGVSAGEVASMLRRHVVLVGLAGLFITLSIASDVFLTQRNLLNILQQWAPVGIMTMGATVVLIGKGFDLSIGGIFTLSGITAVAVAAEVSVPLGILAGMGAGALLGLLNGLLVTAVRINAFVATLGTSIVFSGFAAGVTGGTIQTVRDQSYGFVSNELLGVRLSTWMMFAVFLALTLVLAKTTAGRYTFAVGANEEAARLAGVRVNSIRTWGFVVSGLAAGIAAVITSSRSLTADAGGGDMVAWQVWTAMLIGGNSMLGGEGAMWRALAGVFLLALIGNGFDLLGVNPLYQQVATGSILVLAVGLDALGRSKRH
jgi:ribose transport system permease protein